MKKLVKGEDKMFGVRYRALVGENSLQFGRNTKCV